MDNDELTRKLEAGRHRVGEAVMRDDGIVLFHVDGAFMFRFDAADLANGVATLDAIIKRNEGKVFPKLVMR